MSALSTARERLQMYRDAERRVLQGQSYTIGNMQLTRANLAEIRKAIADLESQVTLLSGGTLGKSARVVFMD